MTIEKKTIRTDIPGHLALLNGAPAGAQEDSRRLVVGRGITLSGEISACDHLVVEGTVNARDFAARRMDVLEAGAFSGTAQVQDAVISGRFDGTLTVSGRLVIKSTGRLGGEIKYGALECESGARIEGQITALPPAPAAAAPVAAAPLVNDNVEKLFDDADDEETAGGRPKVFRRAIGY
jgi:cytoskeletal protein CcmA (bactofilin family)